MDEESGDEDLSRATLFSGEDAVTVENDDDLVSQEENKK